MNRQEMEMESKLLGTGNLSLSQSCRIGNPSVLLIVRHLCGGRKLGKPLSVRYLSPPKSRPLSHPLFPTKECLLPLQRPSQILGHTWHGILILGMKGGRLTWGTSSSLLTQCSGKRGNYFYFRPDQLRQEQLVRASRFMFCWATARDIVILNTSIYYCT